MSHPPNFEPPKLAPINIRTTQERRRRIESLSLRSGRSLTHEIERLLDFALDYEKRMGGEELAESISLIGQTAGRVLHEGNGNLNSFRTRAQIAAAIRVAVDWALPPARPEATEDFDLLEQSVANLNNILPQIITDFDATPLAYLAQARPLLQYQFENYQRAIGQAAEHYSNDEEALRLLAGAEQDLIDAQRRAELIQQVVLEHSRLGASRAQKAILNMLAQRLPPKSGRFPGSE